MGIIPLAVMIMAVALAVLVAFLIPTIIEIRKTVAAARELIANTDSELKPILREVNEALADVRVVTHGVAEKVDEVTSCMEAVGDTGRNIKAINAAIGGVAGLVGSSSVWLTGAKTAGRFVIDRFSKKRG
jgi:uncharacterized protein YoxC